MNLFFHIPLSLLLLLAFYQDWKFRAITWFLFPLLAIVTSLIFLQVKLDWNIIGLNLTFVTLVIGTLFLYVSVREQKWTNIFKRHFGIGDLLFFVVVTPLFSTSNYILFFISGMFISSLAHIVVSQKKADRTIPLAGYLALYIIALDTVSLCLNLDLFYTNIL